MRSRFTAHFIGDEAYLHRTYATTAQKPFAEAKEKGPAVNWVRLVIHDDQSGAGSDIGFVEFSAFYRDQSGEHEMRERSEFRRVEGKWLYTRAVPPRK
jgi:SEC-C motif-containing protein